jgi:hypothetical protein
MRYKNIESKILDDGKTVLKTKLFVKIPKSNEDTYIITQETDRLDTLANQFYKDSTLWWIIALANNLNSADIGVEPGIQLRIPANLGKILNELYK